MTGNLLEQEKYELFCSMFIYRKDAIAFHNGKRWAIKYRDYANKTLQPFTLSQFRLHISGAERMGTYSTIPGSHTCKWIVADFDDNEAAFVQCLQLKQELAIQGVSSFAERSYSGKGYHLWIWFKEPITAGVARRMILGALQKAGIPIAGTMKKGSLSSRSLDRLFPSQDFVQSGGFGNQISLPLFGQAVEKGNTCFIDDQGNAILDQWKLLLEIQQNYQVELTHPAIQILGSAVSIPAQHVPIETKDETFTYWHSVAALGGQFERMQECEAIQASLCDADQFNNSTWTDILSNIAVYSLMNKGREAREFAHIVSEGYRTYTSEETDKVFSNKVAYIQQGNHPTSCLRLSEHGWTCPRYTSCSYRMIAKYGVPPSYQVYDSITPIRLPDRARLYQLEQHGLYEEYRSWVYTDKIKVQIEDKITKEHKWIPVSVTDEKIARHILGIEEFQVRTVSRDWSMNRSIYVYLHPDKAAELERQIITDSVDYWKASASELWIMCSSEMSIFMTRKILADRYKITGTIFDVSLENFYTASEWQKAPFFDDLEALERLLLEEETYGHI